MSKNYFMVEVILNKEVIATSKAPCNPYSEGFRKGLKMLAEKHNVSIAKLTWRRKQEPVVRKSRIDYIVEEANRLEQQAQAQQAQD